MTECHDKIVLFRGRKMVKRWYPGTGKKPIWIAYESLLNTNGCELWHPTRKQAYASQFGAF